jgi:hypothetical protein
VYIYIIYRRQKAPVSWLETINRQLTKENGGVPPSRRRVWQYAAQEIQRMENLDRGRQDPTWLLKQWSLRKSQVQRALEQEEAEQKSHMTRANKLQQRAEDMETELLQLRVAKERSVSVAMTSLAALHQCQAQEQARQAGAPGPTLLRWERCARQSLKNRARGHLLRYFGRKRRKLRKLLSVHGGGVHGKVSDMLAYADVLRRQVATLGALRTGVTQLQTLYAAADTKLQDLKDENDASEDMLAALRALEVQMHEAMADVLERTKFYSSVEDGFAEQVASRAYRERAQTQLALNVASSAEDKVKRLNLENQRLLQECAALRQQQEIKDTSIAQADML